MDTRCKTAEVPLACIHGFICSIRIHIKLINIWYSSCVTQSISTYTLASFNLQCEKKGSWCQKILMDMAGLLVGKHGIWFDSLSKSGELGFRKFKQFKQAIIAKLSWMRLLLTKTSLFQVLRGKYGHIARSGKGGWRERTIDMERFWKSYYKCMICRWY